MKSEISATETIRQIIQSKPHLLVSELTLLERIIYRHRNSQRRSKAWSYIEGVWRFGKLLRMELTEVVQAIKERDRTMKKTVKSQQHAFNADVDDTILDSIRGKMIRVHQFARQMKPLLVGAYALYKHYLEKTLFLSLSITLLASLARIYVLCERLSHGISGIEDVHGITNGHSIKDDGSPQHQLNKIDNVDTEEPQEDTTEAMQLVEEMHNQVSDLFWESIHHENDNDNGDGDAMTETQTKTRMQNGTDTDSTRMKMLSTASITSETSNTSSQSTTTISPSISKTKHSTPLSKTTNLSSPSANSKNSNANANMNTSTNTITTTITMNTKKRKPTTSSPSPNVSISGSAKPTTKKTKKPKVFTKKDEIDDIFGF